MEDHRAEYLVEQYSDMILRLGFSWLGDMDDAMDICQEVLLKLLTDQRFAAQAVIDCTTNGTA